MNIWIIQTGEPLPLDAKSPRLLRSGLFAKTLAQRGHKVLWWAATFNHSQKKHRFPSEHIIDVEPGLSLILMHSPGYKKNISLQRLKDHRILGRRFRHLAAEQPMPDVIHCGFPPIELAYESARYGKKNNIPVVLDARDMWPDIYLNAFPAWARMIGRIAFWKDFMRTARAFRECTAISGHTPGFVKWGLGYARRLPARFDKDFPFAYSETKPGPTEIDEATLFWRNMGIHSEAAPFIVCFFGAFMSHKSLDLQTPIKASGILQTAMPSFRLVLCGSGPREQEYRTLTQSQSISNILFPGWVDYPKIWTLMRMSKLGLLPYLPTQDYGVSIPNKAIEYLSASLPVLTSLTSGYFHDILSKADCGIFYKSGDPADMAEKILELAAGQKKWEDMQAKAGTQFRQYYRAERVYGEMADYLEDIVRSWPDRLR